MPGDIIDFQKYKEEHTSPKKCEFQDSYRELRELMTSLFGPLAEVPIRQEVDFEAEALSAKLEA